MKTLILSGAAALALAVTPAIAQDSTHHQTTMTVSQQTMYDGWSAEERSAYDAWPAELQTYYWTLNPNEQRGWWALTDDQRVRVHAMTPEQRQQAWASINAQISGSPTNATATTARAAATAAGTGNIRWVSNEVVQTTPADTRSSGDELPICTPNQQDNCINAWEAGKRGPGVTRPLDHWPGKPASEM